MDINNLIRNGEIFFTSVVIGQALCLKKVFVAMSLFLEMSLCR